MKNNYFIKRLFILSLIFFGGIKGQAQFADLGCGSILMEKNLISVGQTSMLEADIRNFGFTDIIPGGALVTISVPSSICAIVSVDQGTNPIWTVYSTSFPSSITLRNSGGTLPADFNSYKIRLKIKAVKPGSQLIINCSATLSPVFLQPGALKAGEINSTNNAQRSSIGVTAARPVMVAAFSGSVSACTTLLQWMATQEENCKEYQMQVSHDGISYSTLGSIVSGGESNTERSYQYRDNSPSGGKNYYRLRIVDMDGKVTYSNETTVLITCDDTRIVLYPNPVIKYNSLHVNIAGYSDNIKGEITDASGKLIGVYQLNNGVNTLELKTASPGNYVLRLNDVKNGQFKSVSFIVIK